MFIIGSNRKLRKKRFLSKMHRLIGPKSPLTVFSELYKDIPIKLIKHICNNDMMFSASIEVRYILKYNYLITKLHFNMLSANVDG